MAKAPSTENYTLGKGVVYFNKKDQATGLYLGERDLGNSPEFSFNIALEKLEHFSSRGGIRAKDKEIISQITPGCRFVLDEVNKENLAMLSMATLNAVTQAAGAAVAEVIDAAHLGMRSQLGFRDVGSYIVTHGAVTGGPFVVGEEVTSAGTGVGTVLAVGAGSLVMVVTAGTFANTELLTGGTSNATATSSAAQVWNPGVILVQDDADAVTYTAGTDYQVNTLLKDNTIGRILFLESGTIVEGDEIHVTYNYKAVNYTQIRAFTETIVEGKIRFVSDNPVGTQQELEIWRASITPDGDTAMIGDDWSTLGFVAEILKDESNVDSPYMNITIVD